jgi:hypothetical protein
MIGICFHRETRWEQDQWSCVFSNFGITKIWEMGDDGNSDLKIHQATTKISKTSQLPDKPLVILAPQDGRIIKGIISIDDFQHPEECIYLFGGSHQVLTDEVVDRKADFLVYIPFVKHESYSHSTAYYTLAYRKARRGQSSN